MKWKTALIVGVLFVGLVFVSCAPNVPQPITPGSEETGTEGQENVPAWSISADCRNCHETEVQSSTNGSTLFSIHANQDEVKCTSCHTDNDGKLTKAHEKYSTAKLPKKLKRTAVGSEQCTACHDKEAIKAETAEITVLTDSKGKTVNPHDLPQSDNHEKNIVCTSCHSMHAAESVETTAPQMCLGCHHAKEYTCHTCHE